MRHRQDGEVWKQDFSGPECLAQGLTFGAEAEGGLIGRGGNLSAHLLHENLQVLLVLGQLSHGQQLHTSKRFVCGTGTQISHYTPNHYHCIRIRYEKVVVPHLRGLPLAGTQWGHWMHSPRVLP